MYKNELHKYLFGCFNPLNFNKTCINNLSYMIVTHYQNKTFYNRVLFRYKYYGFVYVSCIHGTHPQFNNVN